MCSSPEPVRHVYSLVDGLVVKVEVESATT
jgi:hypothetical protein